MRIAGRKEKGHNYMFTDQPDQAAGDDNGMAPDATDMLALMIAAAQIVLPVILIFILIFGAAIFVFMNVFK